MPHRSEAPRRLRNSNDFQFSCESRRCMWDSEGRLVEDEPGRLIVVIKHGHVYRFLGHQRLRIQKFFRVDRGGLPIFSAKEAPMRRTMLIAVGVMTLAGSSAH